MNMIRRSRGLLLCVLACGLPIASLMSDRPASAKQRQDARLIVFAAASLTDVLKEIGANYTNATGTRVRFSFAATSALARQIESGARVDVFVSADQEWMDYLEERGLIDGASREDILKNRLALIAPRNAAVDADPADGAAILAALQERRLALADPEIVPAGKYARDALTRIGIWERVKSQLARAENVRAALMYVARGEVPLGIVYATDARLEPRVRVLGLFATSVPITYPVAALDSKDEQSMNFIQFLGSRQSRDVFESAGFEVVSAPDRHALEARAGSRNTDGVQLRRSIPGSMSILSP